MTIPQIKESSTHDLLMADLYEAITHKMDKFYELRTEYAQLLSNTDILLKPIDNILYQRDILYKFNQIAAQGLLDWKKADILELIKNYDTFRYYLLGKKTQDIATDYELKLCDAFNGDMGEYFKTLLEEMLIVTDKRDNGFD